MKRLHFLAALPLLAPVLPSASSSVAIDGPVSAGDTSLQLSFSANEAIGTLPRSIVLHNGVDVTSLASPTLVSETAIDADGDGVYEQLDQTYSLSLTSCSLQPGDRVRIRMRLATSTGETRSADEIRVR